MCIIAFANFAIDIEVGRPEHHFPLCHFFSFFLKIDKQHHDPSLDPNLSGPLSWRSFGFGLAPSSSELSPHLSIFTEIWVQPELKDDLEIPQGWS